MRRIRHSPSSNGIKVGCALLAALLLTFASLAEAEVSQNGTLRVAFEGKISPRALPRQGAAPIGVLIGGQISTTDGTSPPQLKRIEIEINKAGRFDFEGLPTCSVSQIQPSTTQNAIRTCRQAKVGEGTFSANVLIPEQSPFPSQGRVVAFNGMQGKRHVILAHVYGTNPIPTSYTLPLLVSKAKGTYGTKLTAYLPKTTGDWGFVTGLELSLRRTYYYRGHRHSYLSAGCPAPKGFRSVFFPLARASFAFAGGRTLDSTLTRRCGAR
ncbi:MAG TPA: hypothetical protein VFP23_07400 [Solirubrobacterales bacterium]|nr:hypothetical protein [Solirubrobacterales bacterium]